MFRIGAIARSPPLISCRSWSTRVLHTLSNPNLAAFCGERVPRSTYRGQPAEGANLAQMTHNMLSYSRLFQDIAVSCGTCLKRDGEAFRKGCDIQVSREGCSSAE